MRIAVKDVTKEPHIIDEMSDWIINKIESGVEKKEENEVITFTIMPLFLFYGYE